MTFIVDCSIVMAWLMDDEKTEATDALLLSMGEGTRAAVPPLFFYEISNALVMTCFKGKRISQADLLIKLQQVERLPIDRDGESDHQATSATAALAGAHGLTAYDAAYLELAKRKSFPLATLDKELRRAAKAENIKILP